MNHRIEFSATGDPEVLGWSEAPLPEPGPGQVRLRQEAIGVNFVDTFFRRGLYLPPSLPSGLGLEAAGVVEALGPGVDDWSMGDRVAYVDGPLGAYAEARVFSAERLVPLPSGLPAESAAAVLLKGLTAHMLIRRVWRPVPGTWGLVHSASGGVGLLLTQWLAKEGVRVLGVVSREAKADLVRQAGAEEVLVAAGPYDAIPSKAMALTAGRGMAVAFDPVGAATLQASLDSLAPFGLLVSYGEASGPLPPVDIAALLGPRALAIQRATYPKLFADPADLRAAAAEVFQALAEGALTARIHERIPLREAARAHRLLESRSTQGALVLVP